MNLATLFFYLFSAVAIGSAFMVIASRNPVDVPFFDAFYIDPSYGGKTTELVEEVVRLVREDFLGYNVEILSSYEGSRADNDTTQVHFGTLDYALLGVAEGAEGDPGAVVELDAGGPALLLLDLDLGEAADEADLVQGLFVLAGPVPALGR